MIVSSESARDYVSKMSPAHRRGLQLDLQINKELDSLSKLLSCKQAVEKGLSGSLRSIASLEFMLV